MCVLGGIGMLESIKKKFHKNCCNVFCFCYKSAGWIEDKILSDPDPTFNLDPIPGQNFDSKFWSTLNNSNSYLRIRVRHSFL